MIIYLSKPLILNFMVHCWCDTKSYDLNYFIIVLLFLWFFVIVKVKFC